MSLSPTQAGHTSTAPRSTATPPPEPADVETTQINPYSTWTKQDLRKGIKETKAQIKKLEREVAADKKRQQREKMAALKAGIKEVKAKLKGLGGDAARRLNMTKAGGKRVAKAGGKRRRRAKHW